MKIFSLFSIIGLTILNLGGVISKPARAEQNILNSLAIASDFQQSSQVKCWPLDLVLLVDQSKSMSEDQYHDDRGNFYDKTRVIERDGNFYLQPQSATDLQTPVSNLLRLTLIKPSDPNNYRFLVVNTILTELVNNKFDECPQATHRFGLVTFGGTDEAKAHIQLAHIDPKDKQSVTAFIDSFNQNINNAKSFTAGTTDFAVGFNTVQKLFSDIPINSNVDINLPANYDKRREVVMLLTDGDPYTTKLDLNYPSYKKYMCNLLTDLNESNWKNRHIYVLSLNTGKNYLDQNFKSCNLTLRKDWETLTNAHSGELFSKFTTNEQEILAQVRLFIDREFGRDSQKIQCDQYFYVDPFLDHIILNFDKNLSVKESIQIEKYDDISISNPQPRISLRDGGVKDISKNNQPLIFNKEKDYTVNNQTESYTIYNPPPGRWKFGIPGVTTKDCNSKISATYRHVRITANMVSPNNPLQWFEKAPDDSKRPSIGIKLSSRVNNNQPLTITQQTGDFALLVTARSTAPSGQMQEFALSYDNKTATWVSQNKKLQVSEVGNYVIAITGTSKVYSDLLKPDLKSLVIFTDTQKFESRYLEEITFKTILPTPNQVMSCNEVLNRQPVVSSIPVSLSVLNEKGKPIEPNKAFKGDLSKLFIAVLKAKNKEIARIELKPSSDGPEKFSGELKTQIFNKDDCGTNQVVIETVDLEEKINSDQYVIDNNMLGKPLSEITITRELAEGVIFNVIHPSPTSTLPVHSSSWDSLLWFKQKVIPISIRLSATNLDNIPLDPANLANNQEGGTLYQAKIISPDGISQTIKLIATLFDGIKVLEGTGADSIESEGTYTLELTPQLSAFKPNIVPEKKNILVKIVRQDTPMTSIWWGNVIKISSFSLLALLLGLTAFALTGGPGGELIFTIGKEKIPVPLTKMRIMTTRPINHKDLNRIYRDLSIESITIRKNDKHSVDCIVKKNEGSPNDRFSLTHDEPLPLGDSGDSNIAIKYKSPYGSGEDAPKNNSF